MAAILISPSGIVTSRRIAWYSPDDESPVWTWGVDRDQPPYEFESTEEARRWLNEVYGSCLTRREREEKSRWIVSTLETGKEKERT